MGVKIYTFSEVSQNNHSKACWLIISGKVYNVTPFLDEHPGGEEMLLTSTGKDATFDFEDVGHSKDAEALMDKYYIGEVDSSTLPKRQEYIPPPQVSYSNPDKTSDLLIKILQVTVPLAVLCLALSFMLFTKSKE